MSKKSFDNRQLSLGSFIEPSGPSHSTGKGSGGYSPCHKSHEPFTLLNGTVLGANCSQPRSGYDIYVGLDHTMADMRGYPWHGKDDVVDVHFPITDMSVPKGKDVAEFKAMVTWLCNQLQAGKKVHIGCIGGHGRTGLVLAALYKEATGEDDAITKIRAIHCQKAVESSVQIDFLHDHYGITKVEASKGGGGSKYDGGWSSSYKSHGSTRTGRYSSGSNSKGGYSSYSGSTKSDSSKNYGGKAKAYRHFEGQRTIWSPV